METSVTFLYKKKMETPVTFLYKKKNHFVTHAYILIICILSECTWNWRFAFFQSIWRLQHHIGNSAKKYSTDILPNFSFTS